MAQKNKRCTKCISEDEELDSAYRNVSGYKGKHKDYKSRSYTPIIVAVCIAIVAIIICMIAGYLYL